MRLGTAIWLIGWLFVLGAIGETELKKNPDYKMKWTVPCQLLVFWPLVIGVEYVNSYKTK